MLQAYGWPQSVAPGEPVDLHVSTDAATVGVEVARDGASRDVVLVGGGRLPGAFLFGGAGGMAPLERLRLARRAEHPHRRGSWAFWLLRRRRSFAGGERADAFLGRASATRCRSSRLPDRSCPPPPGTPTTTGAGPRSIPGGTRRPSDTFSHRLPGSSPSRTSRDPAPARPRGALVLHVGRTTGAPRCGAAAPAGGTGSDRCLRWAEAARVCHRRRHLFQDLERHPEDPRRDTGCLLSVGHDEYWSWEMRDAVEGFVAAGGNAASCRGNYLHVAGAVRGRRLDDGQPQVRRTVDPGRRHAGEHLVTACGRTGDRSARERDDRRDASPGVATRATGSGCRAASGAYTVWRPDHWAFEGTDLRYGDGLGTRPIRSWRTRSTAASSRSWTACRSPPEPTARPGLIVLATAPARLWSQDEQPSRYAHEPGEVENRDGPLRRRLARAGPSGEQQPPPASPRSRSPTAARCSTSGSRTGRTA